MSTKAEREEQYRSLDTNGVKNMIRSGMNGTNIKVVIKPSSIQFMTPAGSINLSDQSIQYYYGLFESTIQHAKTYQSYIGNIDSILNESDPNKMCKNLKDIITTINASEIYREQYSVITQWLNDKEISKDDVASLYKAYGNTSISGLPQNLVNKFTNSIKRTLWYYNILFLIFEIFDKTMFDGEEPQDITPGKEPIVED